jgi:hypothetical protein
MTAWLQLVSVVLILAAVYLLLNPRRKPRVLPPPRSNRGEPSYQEANSLAKLFVEVLALKDSAAKWPTILQKLNLEDEPHIRTLLLELRSHCAADPSTGLEAIERACIAAKREGQSPPRAELLGRALTVLQGAKSG